MRCGSSTRPARSRSFHGVWLPKTRISLPRWALELCDLFMGIGALDDAGVVPRRRLVRGQAVGDDDLVDRRVELLADASTAGNLVSQNAFAGNRAQARDLGAGNRWDDGSRGNYWSDFEGRDPDGDGILDGPRAVEPEGIDRFPVAHLPPE